MKKKQQVNFKLWNKLVKTSGFITMKRRITAFATAKNEQINSL